MRSLAVAPLLVVACANSDATAPVDASKDAIVDAASEHEADVTIQLFACGADLTCDPRDEWCHVTVYSAQNGLPPPPPTFVCETTDGAVPTCGDASSGACGCTESDAGDVTFTECK